MVFFGPVKYNPEYFCFCYNLRKGCIFVGIVYLIFYFFMCAFLLWHPCYTNVLTTKCPVRTYCWTMVCIINILNILGVITSVGFLFGIFCEIRRHVTRFLYIIALAGIFSPLVFNVTIIILAAMNPPCFYAPNLGLCIIFTVLYITITAYIISVVKSFRSGMDLDLPKASCAFKR